MAAEDDEWSVKANDVFTISLVAKAEDGPPKTIASFQPTWTYPIFGNEETIYGYQGLKVNLRYNASDMRPHFSHTKSQTVPLDAAEQDLTDIKEDVEPFLPTVAFGKKADFEAAVKSSPDDWKPPGTLIETSEGADGTYEIWMGRLDDPAVLQIVRRIQILVSMFIEGGSPIRTESGEDYPADPLDRWTVFFLYHKRPVPNKLGQSSYVFAGYATVYRLYILQPPTDPTTGNFELPRETIPFSEFPCRSRISQFIILPPFHKKGNGMRLYSRIYKTLLDDKNTFEITVEDPNEDFDVVRDMADMMFLRDQPTFNELIRINTDVEIRKTGVLPQIVLDKKALEGLRLKYKIAPRQFNRLVEMHTFFKLPNSVRPTLGIEEHSAGKKKPTPKEEHEYKLWKLLSKSRIYAQNKEIMSQLEPDERIQKLDETLMAVELEYAFLLVRYETRKAAQEQSGGKKRKADGDEQANSKKARVGDI
ncbi:Histone acetyltransferase type B catalytic subunit [Cytospora mali]|uniref:Histone acetyltransferase type B catalytic subunit n=1 Tax=Cytospora mali TaxID=578113 RepID=A0A194V5Y8_CYTMA|nr:Histone acetyltransferase type B catalytic subunit [Valsa mali var. pyri (nom. inval.)]